MDRPSESQTSPAQTTTREGPIAAEPTASERLELQHLLPTVPSTGQHSTHGRTTNGRTTGGRTTETRQAAPNAPVSTAKATRGQGSRACSAFSPWTADIVYALIGLAFLVALAVMLKIFDGRPLSDWAVAVALGHYSVNLSINFIVSTLGTFSKASLAVSIETTISQSKWIWFAHGKRPLLDYKTFDDASRGPLGSMRLLLLTKLRDFASLGALIVILSLTFDPFLQLLVTYQSVAVIIPSPGVQIARSVLFNEGAETTISTSKLAIDNNTFCNTFTSPSFNIVGAIQQGFLVSNQSLLPQPNYACPSANCTWPAFTSLAVCSKCTNISAFVQATAVQNGSFGSDTGASAIMSAINYSVGTGQSTAISIMNPLGPALFEGVQIQLMAASASSDPSQTLTMQDSQTLLFSLLSLYSDESFAMNKSVWESTPIHAVECGLSLCTNLYQSEVINGTLSENITATASVRVPSSYQSRYTPPGLDGCTNITNLSSASIGNSSWSPAYLPYYIPRSDFSLEAPNSTQDTVNITQAALDSIIKYLSTLVVSADNPANVTLDSRGVLMGSEIMRAIYAACNASGLSSASSNSSVSTPFSPAPVFANLAYALTSAIRNAGNSKQFQYGSMEVPTTYIQIRWGAITVPAVVLGSTLIFLAVCIWRTARSDLKAWKENPLPSLIVGLVGEAQTRANAKLDEKQWTEEALNEVCRDLRVELKERTKPELDV